MSSIDFEECLSAISKNDPGRMRAALLRQPRVVHERDPEQRTLLLNVCFPMFAIANIEMVRMLLEHGADASAVDQNGMNGLHGLALHHSKEFPQPIFEIGCLLKDRGLNIDAVDMYGNTPLWRAVFESSAGPPFDAVVGLLRLGADINKKNKKGNSPMDMARKIEGRAELARTLQEWRR
ncbi:MAG: ankyrin repeat domain-containing protein [bacterium]|jgi:ankyrin repeat protein